MTTQEKILALAEKVKNPPSWWWKVLGGILFLCTVVWLRYMLARRSTELAEAKTQLAANKLKAEQDAIAAKVHQDETKRKEAEAAAAAAMASVVVEEKRIAELDTAHNKNIIQLQAVADKDWDALNKIAGVK